MKSDKTQNDGSCINIPCSQVLSCPSFISGRFRFVSKADFFFIALFVFSLVLNLLILNDYLKSPYAQTPVWDAKLYWGWAKKIAAGELLGNNVFHQTPLYPYFLSLIISLFGEKLVYVYIVQSVLSACSTVIIYSIVKKITGQKTAGIIGGLLFALYGMQVFYSMKILPECLAIFLMLLATRLLFEKEKYLLLILSGISLGMLAAGKPHVLLIVPFVPLYFYLFKAQCHWNIIIKKSLCFLVPVACIVGGITLRNYIIGKDFVLISSNGGACFYVGNYIDASGVFSPAISWGGEYMAEDESALAQEMAGEKMKSSEVSKFWFKQGLHFIANNPAKYLKLQTKKLEYIFSGEERSSMYYLYFERAKTTPVFGIAFINFYLLLPVFIIGIITSARLGKIYFLPFAFLLINMAIILIFFYDTRFMLLAMPYWIIFGATGAWQLYSAAGHLKIAEIAKHPLTIILIIAAVLSGGIYIRDRNVQRPDCNMYETLGEIYFEQNKLDAAIKAFAQACYLKKNNWMPLFGVSKVCFRKGRKDLAVKLYNDAFPNLSADFKKIILRDKDLDPIREYIGRKD